MIFTRKYNLVNNIAGWGVFVIALLTYWLTLEPTASYWDCGEFIIQADKLEIGHPPGNPIFMLTARFFSNLAFGDSSQVALMVNAMSGLLSALTILLLFWTITHLVRRLAVKDSASELSLLQYLTVMGSGVCGALAYAWSDTFWFSAVEGEVYAFSSFCTALVFWLILKWENRANQPHSDRYLILIAYIIGVSIAVHLLNLLCIPAIVLVYCYRKIDNMNVKKSLLALLIGFAIIVFVLYGLVPGFIEVAGWFELLAVNTFGMPFNSGVLIYTVIVIASMAWALWELYMQRSALRIRISFLISVFLSGTLFIGSGIWIGIILTIALAGVLFYIFRRNLPVRWLNIAMWSIAVIFVGYSSYALILLRSNANTPMNQNSPDNVFALSSYLNREQYGETPLLYGHTFESRAQNRTYEYENSKYGIVEQNQAPILKPGKVSYSKGLSKSSPENLYDFMSKSEMESNRNLADRGKDYYALKYEYEEVYNPELNILLPRIHSPIPSHAAAYALWVPGLYEDAKLVDISSIDERTGEPTTLLSEEYSRDENDKPYHAPAMAYKPTFAQNLTFFFKYQLNHMYWRYFLWNFAGRQNDINNQLGEVDAGNWISGIPFIDNARLGDQSMLPPEYGTDNKGHNVYYMLPLLLGILGLLWQAFRGRRGIEQFWVVFFLFFMTGIAIVIYLNQPPLQPRERDYAFAGSFYAFAIWIGMGVAALRHIILWGTDKVYKYKEAAEAKKPAKNNTAKTGSDNNRSESDKAMTNKMPPRIPLKITKREKLIATCIAVAFGIIVPLQMVSQTWDDHDRSGRYAARDFAINYLNSLEPNAIIFCNGDNDTFPLWYAQEVEGVRPDVKIINLSYLSSDWYANQQRLRTYDAPPVKFTATPEDIAYGRREVVRALPDRPDMDNQEIIIPGTDFYNQVPLLDALKEIYSEKGFDDYMQVAKILHANTYIDVDEEIVRKRGLVPEGNSPVSSIPVGLNSMSMGKMLMLDIIATNAANGWERPIYWACTVGTDNYEQFLPYVRFTGMAYQLVPYVANGDIDTDISYDIVKKYLWGGADNLDNIPYFDETAGRMLSATRMTVLQLADRLTIEGQMFMYGSSLTPMAKEKFDRAAEVLGIFDKYLMSPARPLSFSDIYSLAKTYCTLGECLKNKTLMDKGLGVLKDALIRYAYNAQFANYLADIWGFKTDDAGRPYGLNIQLTPENDMILFSYFELVKAYNLFSAIADNDFDQDKCSWSVLTGDELTPQTLDVLKKAGISDNMLAQLKKYYLQARGDGDVKAYPEAHDEIDALTEELARWAEIVVEMQGKSPTEYAGATDEEREIDSAFILGLQQYLYMGGSEEDLAGYAIFDKVDYERSMRVSNAYVAAHPELTQE